MCLIYLTGLHFLSPLGRQIEITVNPRAETASDGSLHPQRMICAQKIPILIKALSDVPQ
jgi:hypothetical protein